MKTYNIVIDKTMLQNIAHTDLNESLDLFSFQLVLYVVLLGILPSFIIYKIDIKYGTFKEELFSKLKTLVLSFLLLILIVFTFSKFYTSFFREHKPLRFYTNPTYYIYSSYRYLETILNSGKIVIKKIGLDAKVVKSTAKKRVVILVIGEAVRANRFSLNGYERDTNKLLKQEDIINFSQVSSCGTSTAVSVPCMTSIYERDDYSYKKGISTENIVDVLTHAGINVLWRDNNSNFRDWVKSGTYVDYKLSSNNPVCDDECRDMGMIEGLQEYIDSTNEDIFIVLHQMGNHGPAYYKRYPKSYEKFTPVCKTNQLEKCTPEEIGNAYDNTLLYTDYFLSEIISLLKDVQNEKIETAMIYMSDHGESLGENGLYLHGLPYFMAPSEQTHIPAVMWFSNSLKEQINFKKIKKNANNEYSHDNLFHTILGIMNVKTSIYDKQKDIINNEQ